MRLELFIELFIENISLHFTLGNELRPSSHAPSCLVSLQTGETPTLEKLTKYAKQIAEVMSVVHERGVAHRDLKPENIMVSEDDEITIIDFGSAAMLSDEAELCQYVGTPGYASAICQQVK